MLSLFQFLHPAGLSAAGLLLLRIAVALDALLLARTLAPGVAGLSAASLCAGFVVAGLLTRFVAPLCAIAALVALRHAGEPLAGFVVAGGVAAAALTLTGAGAWSIDAYLFGRRVIDLDG